MYRVQLNSSLWREGSDGFREADLLHATLALTLTAPDTAPGMERPVDHRWILVFAQGLLTRKLQPLAQQALLVDRIGSLFLYLRREVVDGAIDETIHHDRLPNHRTHLKLVRCAKWLDNAVPRAHTPCVCSPKDHLSESFRPALSLGNAIA